MQAPVATPSAHTDEAEPPTRRAAPGAPFPTLHTTLTPSQILEKLDLAARRGRMAGFQREPAPALFSVEAFAAPFEHKLIATASATTDGTRLAFRTRALPKMVWIYTAIIVVSIWPGVWLTHSMIVSWFPSWYPNKEWITWAWYMPLLILPLLWMLPRQWSRCRAEAHADALIQIGKLSQELAATPE